MADELVGMTLDNVAEGKLEERFQECLAECVEVFNDSALYEKTSGGTTKVKIVLEVELEREPENSVIGVSVRAQTKKPLTLKVGRSAFLRRGAVVVEPYQQQSLLEGPNRTGATVRSIRPEGD